MKRPLFAFLLSCNSSLVPVSAFADDFDMKYLEIAQANTDVTVSFDDDDDEEEDEIDESILSDQSNGNTVPLDRNYLGVINLAYVKIYA